MFLPALVPASPRSRCFSQVATSSRPDAVPTASRGVLSPSMGIRTERTALAAETAAAAEVRELIAERAALLDTAEPAEPVRTYQRPADRRARPQRWADAVETLRTLQAEYQDWRAGLPESLADSPTAERLDTVCDLDELDLELPRGFGRN